MTRNLFACAAWVTMAWSQSSPPKAPPAQPIPFSHKAHAAAGLICSVCHTIVAPGDRAGIPTASFCMGCHDTVKKDNPAIQTVEAYARDRKPIPWVRVYKLPGFVYFSHQVHFKEAHIACEVCHGPVASREVVSQEKGTSMSDCMKCHDQYKAPNGCDICHDSH